MRLPLIPLTSCFVVLATLPTATLAQEPTKLADYFGFLPLEIYKVERRISNLQIADFDGDGVGDLVVANNARSRIDLLLSTDGPSADDGAFGFGPNRIVSSSRLRRQFVTVNKEIVSLKSGDFDNDGLIDLAFYGTPAELTILYNQGEARFGRPRRIATGTAIESSSTLAVGDLNRDGRDDLAMMTSDELLTMVQRSDGTMSPPKRLPHTASRPGVLQLFDLDGDGGDDLVLLSGDDDPIRVRYSRENGTLGPEERFGVEQSRAIAYGEFNNEQGAEVLTIEVKSGRANVFTLSEGQSGEEEQNRLVVYPMPPGNSRDRAMAVGDLDGDGRNDVLMTDPANAQIFTVISDDEGLGLGTLLTSPGLVDGSVIASGDLEGDGTDEVVVLSEQERMIGLSRFQNGRLSFPNALPIAGDLPIGLTIADLDTDNDDEVLYLTRDENEGNSNRYTLRALDLDEEGEFKTFRWGESDGTEIEGLTGAPDALKVVDINRDGKLDLIIFDPYAPPVLMIGNGPNQPFSKSESRTGPLANVDPSELTVAPMGDGEAVLVARGSFARSIKLDESDGWEVLEQFNTGRSTARIEAAMTIDLDGDDQSEVVLLDRTTKSLLFLKQTEEGGPYRIVKTLAVGSLDFLGLFRADVDGDQRDDLLIGGADLFGVVLTSGGGRSLQRLDSYASDRRQGRLTDLIAGDLNNDGRTDLVLTDTIEHVIEIVPYLGGKLQKGLTFKVFEQKSFRGISDLIEPREIALGDVDGDDRTDLVLIAHDRILVYRQDPGPDSEGQHEARPGEAADDD